MKRLLRRLSRTVAAAVGEDGYGVPAARPTTTTSSSSSKGDDDDGGRGRRWMRRSRKWGKRASAAAVVPEGHVPVCVGEEGEPMERFAVRAELLGEPPFAALLRRAAQEYGYAHPGALRIPCPVAEFRRLMLRLSHDPSPSSAAAAGCYA